MLIFSIPVSDLPTEDLDRPYRYEIKINGTTEIVEIMAASGPPTVTIDPDGRRDVRRIINAANGKSLATFICDTGSETR